MEITSLQNFIDNAESLTISTMLNDEILKIECIHGNMILLSERDLLQLIHEKILNLYLRNREPAK